MAELQKMVYVDEEVTPQVLSVIRNAQKYIIIVTPYIDLWGHAIEALVLAKKKGVDITVVVRLEPDIETNESVKVLTQAKIKVLVAPYLYAKLYINEETIVVSSMNLLKSSSQNSLEIALVIQDQEAKQRIRAYVNDTLMPLATPLSTERNEPNYQPHSGPQTQRSKQATGNCIRCGRPVTLDPGRPLCDECYDVWAQWENVDYPENVCHFCGRPSDVSYGKPLCGECYRKLR